MAGDGNELEDGLESLFDDAVSSDDINKLFGNEPAVQLKDDDDGFVTEEDWRKIFGRAT